VANTFDAVVKAINANKAAGKGGDIGKLPGILGGGFLRGLEGKDKTRFSNVYSDMGMKNKLARGALGFGTDILTDPTNFVSLGLTKAAPAVEGIAESGKAIQAAQQVTKGASKADTLATVAGLAQKAAKATGKQGSLDLNFLGRPVASSEKAYAALAKVGRPIAANPLVDWANNSFRTAAKYPGELKTRLAVGRQQAIGSTLEEYNIIHDAIGQHITPEQGVEIHHAIEKGTDLTGQLSKDGTDMQTLVNRSRAFIEDYHKTEAVHGLTSPGAGAPNYVPKFLPKGEGETDAAKALTSRARNNTFQLKAGNTPKKPFPTLEDFKDANLHPHENITDVLKLRASEHNNLIGRTAFHHDAIDQYGTEFAGLGKTAAQNAAEKSGLVKLTHEDVPTLGKRTVYVPEQVRHGIRTLNSFYLSDVETQKFTKMVDEFQRLWKTGVTTMNPSHYVRNSIGDLFQAWEAGVTDPKDLIRGYRVLRGEGAIQLAAKGGGNKLWDAAELQRMFKEHGANMGFSNTELIGATTPGGLSAHITGPVNTGMEKLRTFNAARENIIRMTTFARALKDEAAKMGGVETFADLNKAASKAAGVVRHYHFDYSDLTQFETRIRRFVPFYTFMRKNMPLQLEMLMSNPGKMAQIPKAFNAIQTMLGTDPQHLPIGEQIPAYMRDVFNLRLQGQKGGQLARYLDVPFPLEDLSRSYSGSTSEVLRKQLGQTSPIARALVENATGKSLVSGAPLHGGLPQYLTNQLPLTRFASNLKNPPTPNRIILPGEQTTQKPGTEIFNFLTGLGGRQITPQMQLSELRRQQTPISARIRSIKTQRINAALKKAGK
jgi:hypothetical protein